MIGAGRGMEIIDIDDEGFFVNVTGEGDPVFLVHGLGLDNTMWRLQQPQLSRYFRVISYDVRGHGKSVRSRDYTISDHAEDLAKLMEKMNYDRAHIVGLSMGSYICQKFILSYPEKVNRMVLAATKSYGKTSSLQALIDTKQKNGESIDLQDILEIFAKACFRNGGTENQLKLFLDSAAHNTFDSFLQAMKALTNFDFRGELTNVREETLVINGDFDELTRLEQAEEIHSLIPRSKMMVLGGCGHCCNIEKPALFNKTLIEFLK